MGEKHDMDYLLDKAKAEARISRTKRLKARQETYKALLDIVYGWEYLTDNQEPDDKQPGFLTFSVDEQFRVRVECNVKRYYIYSQRCPKQSEAANRWNGGREEESVSEVCRAIAQCVAEGLQNDPPAVSGVEDRVRAVPLEEHPESP